MKNFFKILMIALLAFAIVGCSGGEPKTDEGGGDEQETNRYELLMLGPDTLAYRTVGKPRDETETFEYNRWKEKPKVDLHGLELEDTGDEFNKI